jgi:nitrite reductase (cytochrome c-552)
VAMDAVIDLIGDLHKAAAAGATEDQLKTPRELQRRAQFLLDFIEAENSMGFHADQEALRVLGRSVDFSRRGQIALRDR